MDPLAIILVATAAVCHAVWNLYAKRAADGGSVFVWLNSCVTTVAYLPVVVFLVVTSPPAWTWTLLIAVIVTGILHLGYTVVLQRGYQHGDMSVVYPLARGTGPALSVTFAILVFGERPGLLGMLGAVAVVGGILVIGLGRSASGRLSAGVAYGLATGCLIASYTVWDAWAVGPLAISPILYEWGSTVTRSLLLTPHAVRHRSDIRRVWRDYRVPVFVVALIAPAAYVLVLFAYRYAPVSLVAPARELSIVIASVFAWLLLREPQAGRRITGAVVVLLGVAALAFTRG
ncbi:MAG TPA: DMT family transporter [Candidatus Stackebrandtia excrementipullorum]|nr:DMT family transporter [Candidatus Stackebrandtia excrementipullorum]